jgi:head-tail adaptor
MVARVLDPGRLNARLRLETPADVDDGQGGVSEGWVTVTELWGRVSRFAPGPRRGGCGDRAGQPPGHHPPPRGCPHDMRFVFRGRFLKVRAVHDPDESRRYLICDCEEGAP